jgi:hypothetical protein
MVALTGGINGLTYEESGDRFCEVSLDYCGADEFGTLGLRR